MEVVNGDAVWLRNGHKAEVLSVHTTCAEPHLVLSASADGSSRLWDLRTSRSVRLLSCQSSSSNQHEAVNDCKLHRDDVFLCCGNKVARFDLRKPQVILKEYFQTGEWSEEVNEIDLDVARKLIVGGDDTGRVKVVHWESGETLMDMQQAHASVCYSVKFSANGNVLSAGFDACASEWVTASQASDEFGTKKGTVNFSSSDDPNAVTSTGSQLVNPPLVNSLSVSSNLVAYGLGDTTVAVYKSADPTASCVARFGAHLGPVSQVAFDPQGKNLLSAGTDKKLKLWTVSETLSLPLSWELQLPAKPNRLSFAHAKIAMALAGQRDIPIMTLTS